MIDDWHRHDLPGDLGLGRVVEDLEIIDLLRAVRIFAGGEGIDPVGLAHGEDRLRNDLFLQQRAPLLKNRQRLFIEDRCIRVIEENCATVQTLKEYPHEIPNQTPEANQCGRNGVRRSHRRLELAQLGIEIIPGFREIRGSDPGFVKDGHIRGEGATNRDEIRQTVELVADGSDWRTPS